MAVKIKHKRGTAANIGSANPTLASGELGFETDTLRFKLGDGTTAWDSLAYVKPYVSTTDRLLGRSTAGAGVVEEITCTAFGRSLIDDADAAAARTTLGAAPTASPTFTGTVSAAAVTLSGVLVVPSGDTSIKGSGSGAGNWLGICGDAAGFGTGPAIIMRSAGAGGSTEFYYGSSQGVIINSSRQLLVTAGSASAPGVAVSGDTNTGMYSPGADQLAFSTNQTERMRIDASGNVGIGLGGAPNARLQINLGDVAPAASGNMNTGVVFQSNGASRAINIGTDNTAGYSWINSAFANNSGIADELRLMTGATTRLTISSSGVSTFAGQLLVTAGSASACGVAFSGDPDTGIAQLSAAGADTLSICTNSAERVRVGSGGNVAIGAIDPQTALHIDKNADGALVILRGAQTANTQHILFRNPFHTNNGSAGTAFVGAQDTGASGGTLIFATTTNGSGASGTPTERMSIANDGVVKMNDVYGDTVGATNRDLFIDDTGKLGYVSSIRASKTNIAAIDDVTWLRDLTPVSFHYRRKDDEGNYTDDPDGTLDYGLIAEDVEPVAPELCFYDVVDGEPQLRGVHYSKLITPMLRYIQQLEQRIAALEEKLNHA